MDAVHHTVVHIPRDDVGTRRGQKRDGGTRDDNEGGVGEERVPPDINM